MTMQSAHGTLPLEVLISISDLLVHSYLHGTTSESRSSSRKAIGSLYQTNKTFNNRLIPVLFPDPKWGNVGIHLAQAGFYGGDHSYLAQRIHSLSIHLDLPRERVASSNEIRMRRIMDFERITSLNLFPEMPRLERVSLSSEGSLSEDLREMLTKTISLIKFNLKILVLDFHSVKTLFDVHLLELRYEMEVAEERLWPQGLEELTFSTGSRGLPKGTGREFLGKAATFAFQILGGMDILDILDQPDGTSESQRPNGDAVPLDDRNLRAIQHQRKQKGIFRIDFGGIFFENTARILKGIMSSNCFEFDPRAEKQRYGESKKKGFLGPYKKAPCSRLPRFHVNLKGGLKVDSRDTFEKRSWLLQSEEIVLEGKLGERAKGDFADEK